MTADELRREVVRQAESWLGRNEADMSHREIVDIYNGIRPLPRGYKVSYADPWCATFVSAVGQVCGLTHWIYPECSCDRMIALYKAAGRWMEDDAYRPKLGDIIMYDWQDNGAGDNTGGADHVGFVTGLTGDTIHIIEGNCANAVRHTTRQVNGKYIRGYCLPDYKAAGEDANVPVTDETGADTGGVPKFYIIQAGDTLSGIATRYGLSAEMLARLNNLANPNLIWPGQELRLTDGPAQEPPDKPVSNVDTGSKDDSKAARIDTLARGVIRGEYGNGLLRRIRLGKDYDKVQARVNTILAGK